ncbi:MAG: DUF1127 domain-containing protein [Pseudomonadota bacterium]
MATLTTNSTARFGTFAVIANAVSKFTTEVQRRRVQRTTRLELSRLSNRELDDLGISRGDINRIAFQASRS